MYGEYVSLQLYGTISGLDCKKEICKLKQGEGIKSRFGLYLCKDFIPIVNRYDLLKESNYQHYHLLLNSQNFELTADRNNISNDNDPKVKWVLEELDKILTNEIKPIAEKDFFKFRKEEELLEKQKEKIKLLTERKSGYSALSDLNIDNFTILKKPDNEAQVAIIFSALLAKYGSDKFFGLKIGHYSGKSATDMICIAPNGNLVFLELEYRLSNLFNHNHPFESFDYIVCWMVDLEINEKRRTPEGVNLKLAKDGNNWMLKYGPQKVIPVIELMSIIEQNVKG